MPVLRSRCEVGASGRVQGRRKGSLPFRQPEDAGAAYRPASATASGERIIRPPVPRRSLTDHIEQFCGYLVNRGGFDCECRTPVDDGVRRCQNNWFVLGRVKPVSSTSSAATPEPAQAEATAGIFPESWPQDPSPVLAMADVAPPLPTRTPMLQQPARIVSRAPIASGIAARAAD